MPTIKKNAALRDVAARQPEGAPAARQQAEAPAQPDSSISRDEMIRNAAYAAYERRGASGGFEVDDWLEAEREVDARLGARQVPSREA